MYTAHYINRESGAEYYRTIYADTINEAIKIANRWARKGFIARNILKRGSL